MLPYLSPYQIWCKFIKNWLRYAFCVFSKMAAAAILNFRKVTFWTFNDTCIVRVYKRTKFGANRSRIGRDTPFCAFFKMAAAAILDLLFVDFGPSTMTQVLGSMLPANAVMISLNLSEILWFYHFAILAEKCQFLPILGGFGKFWPPTIMM